MPERKIERNFDKRTLCVSARQILGYLRVLCLLTATGVCCAQVQLPAVNLGATNFEDAFGGPGWLLQEFPVAYVASELKDSNGNAIPGSNHVTTYSTTTHVAFVSKKRVLGGWLSGERRWVAVDAEEDWGRSICSSSNTRRRFAHRQVQRQAARKHRQSLRCGQSLLCVDL